MGEQDWEEQGAKSRSAELLLNNEGLEPVERWSAALRDWTAEHTLQESLSCSVGNLFFYNQELRLEQNYFPG